MQEPIIFNDIPTKAEGNRGKRDELTSIESLIPRTAVNSLRQRLPDQAEPQTIEAFLQQISPSMGRHAQVFRDLGIDVPRVPVLAQLDGESYLEFEDALVTGA
ncbi:hypothetical protein BD309DRAFT_871145 [Dichomitus squalens]|nr:hypothetical protein BD309DRAFT_871145 [Dichomitus squalens]